MAEDGAHKWFAQPGTIGSEQTDTSDAAAATPNRRAPHQVRPAAGASAAGRIPKQRGAR